MASVGITIVGNTSTGNDACGSLDCWMTINCCRQIRYLAVGGGWTNPADFNISNFTSVISSKGNQIVWKESIQKSYWLKWCFELNYPDYKLIIPLKGMLTVGGTRSWYIIGRNIAKVKSFFENLAVIVLFANYWNNCKNKFMKFEKGST